MNALVDIYFMIWYW